jgi:hypothetical protein
MMHELGLLVFSGALLMGFLILGAKCEDAWHARRRARDQKAFDERDAAWRRAETAEAAERSAAFAEVIASMRDRPEQDRLMTEFRKKYH